MIMGEGQGVGLVMTCANKNNIRRGGCLMMMLDYIRGKGSQESGKK